MSYNASLKYFYETMASSYESGLPLSEIIRSIQKYPEFSKFSSALLEAVQKGSGLSAAMEKTYFFDKFDIHIVKAAEEAGELEIVFDFLQNFYNDKISAGRKFLVGLIFPGLMVSAIIFVLTLPTFLADGGGLSLFINKLLFNFSGAALIVIAAFFLIKNSYAKSFILTKIINAPLTLFGAPHKKYYSMIFYLLSYIFYKCGHSPKKTFSALKEIITNPVLSGDIYEMSARSEKDIPFSQVIKNTGLITEQEKNIIDSSETAGALEKTFLRYYEKYRDDFVHSLTKAAGLMATAAYIAAAIAVIALIIKFAADYMNIIDNFL